MSSTIHRGRRFDFDDAFCNCGDTEGHTDQCPVCVPEMFTDPDRLLAWLSTTTNRTAAYHVYQVARSWLDPPVRGVDPQARRLRDLIDAYARSPGGPYDDLEAYLVDGDTDAPINERRLTKEATRLMIEGGLF